MIDLDMWFAKYESKLERRAFTFHAALSNSTHAKTIVETGCTRIEDNWVGDGCSTLILADFAKQIRAKFYSVDIDSDSVVTALRIIEPFIHDCYVTHMDSVEYLRGFNSEIDLLYLDSRDFEESNPRESQRHQLYEVKVAYGKLSKDAVIMLDDSHLPYGGKSALSIPYLTDLGWRVIAQQYQTVLMR